MNYLRPIKMERLNSFHSEKFKIKDTLECKSYLDATILPLCNFSKDNLLFGRGGVVDSNGEYIELSGITGRVGGVYDCKADKSDETVVYLGYAVNHWGHFLTEGV